VLIVDCSGSERTIVSWTVKYSMSVLTQMSDPGEARPLNIAPEAIYTSSFCYINPLIYRHAII